MTQPVLLPIRDEGLGNTAYLVDLGDGRALAVDASRDLRALERAAETRGLRVATTADTHLHADFLSGARQLAATDGANVLASRGGKRGFDHRGLDDGDEADLGGLRLRAIGTPGHTEEHLSYLLLDGEQALGVFTGGSLLVGAVARTDLVDPARTVEFARAQYRSVQRLLELPDHVAVWPTHGAGSFCAAATGAPRTSTIGVERATNPWVSDPDEEAFVTHLLGSLGSFPPYFRRLGEANRLGPPVLARRLGLKAMDPGSAAAAQRAGGVILDVRPVSSFAAGHPAAALSIPLRPAFASWLGWLAPPDKPLVLLREPDQDVEEVLWQAAKIGYDNIVGELAGGVDAWSAAGLPTASVPLVDPSADEKVRVLDIRQESEYREGHVRGAVHIELGEIRAALDRLDDVPTVIMCGHGERAMGAASLLRGAGFTRVSVLAGGPRDWADAHGLGLETGL
ncbi:MAG TPA: rhodanese-like domain-containing protein [Dermatophilaceae bacterium]|nr:rhodanese-like domain-containing protein [Dermatophilaceae bacterium]